jgi:hypothetical protein
MSLPSNSSLSDKLRITITETMTWEMNHYGTMDHSGGEQSVVFSMSKAEFDKLEDTLDRYPGRIRAAWGWTFHNQKVEPTLLMAAGLPEKAVAILLRWPSALQSKGNDRTSFDTLTKVAIRDNLLLQGPDLSGEKLDDVFGFPGVKVGVIVMEPSTNRGWQFKSMMTHRRHLQAPIEFLSSGKIPQDKTFDFPIFDGSFFPTQPEVLGGGFLRR